MRDYVLSSGDSWVTVQAMQHGLLSGTHECSLDNRFRLAIPTRLRDPFRGGAMVGRMFDDCAIVVPRLAWDDLVARLGPMNPLDDDQREIRRWVLAGVNEQWLDRQGRILLQGHLREHAGIETSATVIGVGEYLEVWDPERLGERFASLYREGVSARAKRLVGRVA